MKSFADYFKSQILQDYFNQKINSEEAFVLIKPYLIALKEKNQIPDFMY